MLYGITKSTLPMVVQAVCRGGGGQGKSCRTKDGGGLDLMLENEKNTDKMNGPHSRLMLNKIEG